MENAKPSFPAGPGSVASTIERVLIVDDSKLQLRILSGYLEKWGFEVLKAECGEDALNLCRETPPDLVISDWMMPQMTGLEFCDALRKLQEEQYSYFILLTSKSEKNDIAQGLDSGADDFLTKPVNAHELRARIAAGDRILAMQAELSQKNRVISDTLDRLKEAYDKIDKDLIQAKKIQESLVPEFTRNFQGSQVSLLLKPCGHIGGDLVGMFAPDDEHVGFYNIDVSGHGITSAMMTARIGGYLSSVHFGQNVGVKQRPDGSHVLRNPADVAEILNGRLLADRGVDEYFTMVYATCNLNSGIVKLVQAGHPHPAILRRNGTVEFVGGGGPPVGLVEGIPFAQVEFQIEPGDRILFYSDGFTECQMKQGGMLEESGLAELIGDCKPGQSGQEFLDDLFWCLTQNMAPEIGLDDDVSATLFEYAGPITGS